MWLPRTEYGEKLELSWANRILNHAERIVISSPLTMQEMQRRFPGRPAERMITITNGFDGETELTPLRDEPIDTFVVRYVGELNERRRPDVLFEAFQRARQNPEFAKHARLDFVGDVSGHDAKVEKYGLEDVVRLRGRVSREDSLRYMAGSDVNLLLQTIRTGHDVVSGKAYEYLAAKKPILAVVAPDGGDAWLMRETEAGPVVPWDDPEAIAEQLLHLFALWQSGDLADAFRPRRIEQFTRRNLTRQLAQVFDEALGVNR